MNTPKPATVPIADRDKDEELWHAGRAAGVTATDVSRLAEGGIQTRVSMLHEKENGSTFHGNQHTERGHRRELRLAPWIERHFGIPANSILWATTENLLHRATPDGLGKDAGSEIKSTTANWKVDGIPREHVDQCLWGMHVTGRERWLFVWEQIDEHGQFPLEPEYRWIERDDVRTAQLIAAADKFLAWRTAGAPLVDGDIDLELDEAIAAHVAARLGKKQFEEREAAAEAKVREIIAASEKYTADGMDVSGHDGGALYKVTPTEELDLEAWQDADPKAFARFRMHSSNAKRLLDDATANYRKPGTPKTRLTISAHKPAKGTAA